MPKLTLEHILYFSRKNVKKRLSTKSMALNLLNECVAQQNCCVTRAQKVQEMRHVIINGRQILHVEFLFMEFMLSVHIFLQSLDNLCLKNINNSLAEHKRS